MPKVGMTFITDSALTAEQIRKARAEDTETPRRSDSVGNVVFACSSCNSSKNVRTIMEWRMARMARAVAA